MKSTKRTYRAAVLTPVHITILAALLLLCTTGTGSATDVGGAIMTSTTWNVTGSPYTVTSDVTVMNSATLTIEPGVVVNFAAGKHLQIGYSGSTSPHENAGKLVANGTPADKITFTGTSSTPGHWEGIGFYPTSDDTSVINNAVIEYGGGKWHFGGDYRYANLNLYNAAPSITNCEIQHSSKYGIYLIGDSSPTMSVNNIHDNGGYPISVPAMYVQYIGTDTSTNTYMNNNPNEIEVRAQDLTKDGTWIDPGVPYNLTGSVTVKNSATLTLNPGVVIKFPSNTHLQIGYGGSTSPYMKVGKLVANGTPADKITFTGTSSTPGHWEGIGFYPTSDDTSVINNAVIEYGGGKWHFGGDYRYANLNLYKAAPTITNCEIRHSGKYGIYLIGDSSPTISVNNIHNNSGYPIHVPAMHVQYIGTNTYANNNPNEIEVRAQNMIRNDTWIDPDVPYNLTDSMTVQDGATLTIEPGVTIKFQPGKRLQIGYGTGTNTGKLVADGTSSDKITFTGTSSTPGHWDGIGFYSSSDDTSVIDNAIIEYGGGKWHFGGDYRYANLILYKAAPTITNCEIRHSGKYGIYLIGDSSPTISVNNIHNNSGYPIHVPAMHVQYIGTNTYANNNPNEIEVRAQTMSRNDTWIDPDVPYNLTDSMTVRDGATLTIEPGVTIKFQPGKRLQIGYGTGTNTGKLVADGTSTDKITFTGTSGTPGHWGGIGFYSSSDDTSVIDHAVIEYGGGEWHFGGAYRYANLILYKAAPTITNCEIRHSKGIHPESGKGIHLKSTSGSTITGCNISSNEYGIYMDSSSNNNVSCNWVHDNTQRGFSLAGGSTGNTIENNNIIANGGYNSSTGGWEYQFYNDQSENVEAKHNYWGAGMNNDTINASIYDRQDNPGKGNVMFHPFEASSCPCAPIPELATIALLAVGLLALVGYARIGRKE